METVEPHQKLRRFNDILTVIVVLLAVYVVAAPFWPRATYWIQEQSPLRTWTSDQDSIRAAVDANIDGNRLFIPKLGLNEAIHEGGVEQLKNGVVRRSHTSTPDRGSNTVLVGHRFAYDVRGVFYHLDKIGQGDEIFLRWADKTYAYKVSEAFVVSPDQIEIEDSTDQDTLTLYTCTPLWTAKDRLVVRAYLTEVKE